MLWNEFESSIGRKVMATGCIAGFLLCVVLVMAGCKKKEAVAPPPPTVEVLAVVQKDVPIYKEWLARWMATSTQLSVHR